MRYTFLILLALSCSTHLSLEATRVNQPEKYDFDVPGQLPLSQRQRGEDGFGFQVLTSRPLPTPIGKMPSAPKDVESASRTELRLTARLKYYVPPEAAVLFFDEIGMLQDKSPEEAERIGLAMIPRLTSLELFGVKAKQTPAEFNLAVQAVHQETIDQLDDSEARIDQLVQQIAVTLQAQIDNDRANGNKQDEIVGDCCGVQQRMQ
ncbi:MAG: hypothetical protein ACTHJ4_05390, partial [Candidatus Nucleicultricaceae bacterium]